MRELGLPAPADMFGTLATALSTIGSINAAVEKFGARITVRELIGAGLRSEQLMAAGALSASFYLGATVGSLAVATGRSLSGGVSLADVFLAMDEHDIRSPVAVQMLRQNPRLYGNSRAPTGATGYR